MTQQDLSLNLWIEMSVAATVMVIFVVNSLAQLRAQHMDRAAWHVHLGAAIYGALIGLVIGFVIMPLRVYLTNASLPPQYAAISGLSVLGIMILIRRGVIGRLPFIGPQVKAYRRALLRRTIEQSQMQLDKLTSGANGRRSERNG